MADTRDIQTNTERIAYISADALSISPQLRFIRDRTLALDRILVGTMMLISSAFLPGLNVRGVVTSSTARAPAATMKVPQSMESAFVKSRQSLGIQAIPTELRAAIAETFPTTGKTVAPPAAITEAEVLECQAKWAAAIASISATYAEKGDFVGAAGEAAGELYGCLSLRPAPNLAPTLTLTTLALTRRALRLRPPQCALQAHEVDEAPLPPDRWRGHVVLRRRGSHGERRVRGRGRRLRHQRWQGLEEGSPTPPSPSLSFTQRASPTTLATPLPPPPPQVKFSNHQIDLNGQTATAMVQLLWL